ncbi:MAG TPA: carboxypeptidase-like regulatory domain-containing protein, partial [Chitinophagaceae bacterium]|nr:carboxypeptidase-like regulatory domain-containing protein [Chitinophagaceae bacterium]
MITLRALFRNGKERTSFFLTSAFLLISAAVFAQDVQNNNNITIRGKVVDALTRQPLAGATVHIKGTTHEVVTNNNGEFNFLTG